MADIEIHDRLHELELPTTAIPPRKGERVSIKRVQHWTPNSAPAAEGGLAYVDVLVARRGRWLRYDGRIQIGKVR